MSTVCKSKNGFLIQDISYELCELRFCENFLIFFGIGVIEKFRLLSLICTADSSQDKQSNQEDRNIDETRQDIVGPIPCASLMQGLVTNKARNYVLYKTFV